MKVAIDSPRSVFQRKNKVEKRGASSSGVEREQESIDLRAQKMMKGKVELSTMPHVVQIVRQTTIVP
jgi:hypothetical protein